MPVTLAQAKLNTTDDVDMHVIDEFRKSSVILDALTFHDAVSSAGAGATLTYGYHRLLTQRSAAFRAINSEYAPEEVTKARYTVDLKPLGGSFQIDRILAGVARGAEVALQLEQLLKATRTRFQDEVINGDSAVTAEGFDGLNKALAGSDTEMNVTGQSRADWTAVSSTDDSPHVALDLLDEFLSTLDGAPTMILGNRSALAKVRGIARRTGQYVKNPVDDLLGPDGRPILREAYGNVLLVDPGEKAGSNRPIIPVYDTDSSTFTATVTGTPAGGTFSLRVTVDGDTEETGALAFNANAAAIQTALRALPNVNGANVTVAGTGPFTLTFIGALVRTDVAVTREDNNLTGGTNPDVTITETGNLGGLTDLYAIRFGMDGFHGVSALGAPLVNTWLPDFSRAGAVKTGEAEMGPVAVALRATKAAAVLRGIKVR